MMPAPSVRESSLASKPSLGLSALIPPRTDRTVLVGTTGSGKTTLARQLLASYPVVVVHDAKGLLRWPDYRVLTNWRELTRAKEPRLIYRPTARELRSDLDQECFFRWIYIRRNTVLYVDEVYAVAYRDELPPSYFACLTRGRERGIGILSATQRPIKIPNVILSESEHYFIFRLNLEHDRKRVQEVTGVDEKLIGNLQKRQFVVASAGGYDILGPMQLQLKGG